MSSVIVRQIKQLKKRNENKKMGSNGKMCFRFLSVLP